ncbi:hypothetical protein [Luteibacter yeojuensis]|uniref:Uncharacterized protein n=1 Tax=Luteibacter yeojuensis TaxID=345309 RepID=A0A0F3KZZ8_9GAMM|nr:hypothetical protein [Luteibacter yeojuensis]KJV35674.1 hypothetical protein VI08_06595 [Luteibacter yeojuensis]
MFVAGDGYSRAVKELLASDQPLDVAIAFWGKGAEAKALSKGNAPRCIIWNVASVSQARCSPALREAKRAYAKASY